MLESPKSNMTLSRPLGRNMSPTCTYGTQAFVFVQSPHWFQARTYVLCILCAHDEYQEVWLLNVSKSACGVNVPANDDIPNATLMNMVELYPATRHAHTHRCIAKSWTV